MGSDSDLPIMKSAVEILEEFGLKVECCILSAHRTPLEMMKFAENAESNNIKIIIAGAGGSAHLPGMIASLTTIPVIGVPIKSKSLNGIDSLLSIVQMPSGIPVATVAINAAKNAGLLAIQILSLLDNGLCKKIKSFREKIHNEVKSKNKHLGVLGINEFLKNKDSLVL
tara:strand:- start:1147 stop:1653 length:507 start_codon:yes stop_codon:yes gene_type:complete